MHELVDFLVKQIIDEGTYDIVVMEDGNNVEIKIFADKDVISRLIGRSGKIAKAIRTIVKASAHGGDKFYDVFIDERQ
jgi:predicted RNA-binding protein YlqC (UPF0109 family)